MTQPLQTAEVLMTLRKPVVACFMGGEKVEKAKEYLNNKVSLFEDVYNIGKIVGKLAQ